MSQGSNFPYCNVTSDLQLAFGGIEDFAGLETLSTFTAVSGQDKTFSKRNTGYFGAVFENGVAMTEKTSIAEVQATASTFWYDSTNDILYLHCSDDADPDTHTITAMTDDWNDLKTTCRNDAMEEEESYLDPNFPRPLPFARNSYNSAKYDADLVRACAFITVRKIIEHRDPTSSLIAVFWNKCYSSEEPYGLLWEYKENKRAFSFETTKDDFDGRLENLTLDADSTGRVYIAGLGTCQDHRMYRIKIDTAGAVETATYKISDDNGLTWYSTENKTYYNYQSFVYNTWIRFFGTFVEDDEWTIEFAGRTLDTVRSAIGSITIKRNQIGDDTNGF